MAGTKASGARAKALQEAVAEAQRLAREWRDGAEGNDSSHHSEMRGTWADAADKVAEAIAALAPHKRI
jgi:hypothetical protein